MSVEHRRKRILVTGAGGNASMSFVASIRLAPEPIDVIGCDTGRYHLECADVQARYLVPRCSDPSYLDALNRIIEREAIEFVHPQPDPEVMLLSERREALHARTFLPPASTVRRCQDKVETARVLGQAGVPVPRGVGIDRLSDAAAALSQLLGDQGKVWIRATRGAGSRAALPVATAEQATAWMRYWIEMKGLRAEDFMVTEFLPGAEFAFQSLWYEGELVTSMARQRIEYLFGNLMPSGQSSSPSVAVTVHRDDVNAVGAAAVRAVDPRPHGVFCVDMKAAADGQPRVTEINCGRFFTTSNFLSTAGANMPHDYLTLGYGGRLAGERPRFNAVKAGLYWIRGADRKPTLVEEGAWTSRTIS